MSEPVTETEAILPPMFNAKDRCDRCGAQAKLRAVLATGVLLFCGHHGHEYSEKLAYAGAIIESEF